MLSRDWTSAGHLRQLCLRRLPSFIGSDPREACKWSALASWTKMERKAAEASPKVGVNKKVPIAEKVPQ